MKKRIPLLIALICLGLILQLANLPGPEARAEPEPEPGQEIPPGSTPPNLPAVVEGHKAFALDLYRELSRRPGNLFFSPFSVSTALAMTYVGARGETASEMASVLRFPADREKLYPAHARLLARLDPGEERHPTPTHKLTIANHLWGQSGIDWLPAFQQTCRDYYRSDLSLLDFVADPEAARLTINDWAADRTEQRIQNLLLPGDITGDTPLVLTNTIHFLGEWQRAFPVEATRPAPFHISPTKSVEVPMMFQRARFACAELPEVEVLELPYRGRELALVIVLPRQPDGLAALNEKIDLALLNTWLDALREQELPVVLPRFELTHRCELKDALKKMGMVSAFTPGADFTGMAAGRDGRSLWVEKVVHQAFLAVDEKGTEAAAATAVVLKRGRPPFRADHPFLFLIRDLRHGSILFMGCLVDPRA